ncbi:MAG: SIS domain-containing protein [Parvibaculaceae bacterium]
MSTHLDGLYPFLKAADTDAGVSDAELLASARAKAHESADTIEQFFAQDAAIVQASHVLAHTFHGGGTVLTAGNGGSSCDAAHFSVEFKHPITTGRPALPVTNLTSDIAMLTAVSNDIGYSEVYARQVEALGQRGDCLVAFSTSGNSDNLVRAMYEAHEKGLTTIGFCGQDGGQFAKLSFLDACLCVPTSSVHRVQETHLVCYHILWDMVHTELSHLGKRKEVS